MRAIQAIEEFFRGARLIGGNLLAIGIVLLAGLFLVTVFLRRTPTTRRETSG